MPGLRFEILQRCGGGRLGRIETAHGEIRTPCLLPVINPVQVEVPIEEVRRAGAEALMTNAYLIMKHFPDAGDVHQHLGFDGPVVTDSGGYQILRYGEVEVSPEQIVSFQDSIGPDIAVILDVPTGAQDDHGTAERKVEETVERARQAVQLRRNPNVAWCAPVQGGRYLNLVERCARSLAQLEYQVYAIGGPVEYFESYKFHHVVDLVMTAKRHLPLNRPVHLFGAGHPICFSLAVLMGCDLFDSAAYALFAKDDRYLTPTGTVRLEELRELPCECPVCRCSSAEELKEVDRQERKRILALHNLYVSLAEVRRIRQAIWEGRLWEYTHQRCTCHPALLQAFRQLLKYAKWLERFDPVTKPSGFLYTGYESAFRPEVLRHRFRMSRYRPPAEECLILVPHGQKAEFPVQGHVVRIVPPFGVIPEELSDVYPLGQCEIPRQLTRQEREVALRELRQYLVRHGGSYRKVYLLWDEEWGQDLIEACQPVKNKLEVYQKTEKCWSLVVRYAEGGRDKTGHQGQGDSEAPDGELQGPPEGARADRRGEHRNCQAENEEAERDNPEVHHPCRSEVPEQAHPGLPHDKRQD